MRPVLPRSLLRHAFLFEQREDLGIEQFIWLENLEGRDGGSGLGTRLERGEREGGGGGGDRGGREKILV